MDEQKQTPEVARLMAALVAGRQKKGISQERIAEALQTSRRSVGNAERGTVQPKASFLVEYAEEVGMKLELVEVKTPEELEEERSELLQELKIKIKRGKPGCKHCKGEGVIPGSVGGVRSFDIGGVWYSPCFCQEL